MGADQQMLHGAYMAHTRSIHSEHGTIYRVSSDAPALERQDQDHLGQQLRAMYQEPLDEPVPAHFLMLIARLERQDREQGDER